jgi:hypothetical protein
MTTTYGTVLTVFDRNAIHTKSSFHMYMVKIRHDAHVVWHGSLRSARLKAIRHEAVQ